VSSTAAKIILSASRRTDIPAFYMEEFMAGIRLGRFTVTHPFNGRALTVPASTERVHTIVFWSKSYGPFLRGGYGETLQAAGYGLFFNFTVTSENPLLEPRVPPLPRRLDQLGELCRRFGPETVQWRFDPVCFYRAGTAGVVADNLGDFDRIADAAAACGVTRCVTSFVDLYAKIRRRPSPTPGFRFVEPPLEERRRLLSDLAARLSRRGIRLATCCERELVDGMETAGAVEAAACIPGDRLVSLYGPGISLRRDAGQRVRLGCGCTVSRDMGDYRRHPCHHRCLYCYANPSSN
jgi:hypothetical protein